MTKTPSEETKIAILATDVGYIKKGIDNIEKAFDEAKATYATKDEVKALADVIGTLQKSAISNAEFSPVKNIVYGATVMILIAVFGAIIFLATGIKVNIR